MTEERINTKHCYVFDVPCEASWDCDMRCGRFDKVFKPVPPAVGGLAPYPGIGEFRTLDIERIWLEATQAQQALAIQVVEAVPNPYPVESDSLFHDWTVRENFRHDILAKLKGE